MKTLLLQFVLHSAVYPLCLTLIVAPVFSQHDNLKFERISLLQGLSQNNITAIVQDTRGFMWFGTMDGLNKYNGYEFTAFKHVPSGTHCLTASTISALCEDSSGNLWVGTIAAGLNKLNLLTEQITCYRHVPDHPDSLSDDRVRAIVADASGKLWIGTRDGGLNLFDPAQERFSHFRHDPTDPSTLGDDHIRVLFQDREGNLWIGLRHGGLNLLTRDRISKITPETTARFIRIQHDTHNRRSLSLDFVESIYQDNEGNLWVGTYGGGLDKLSWSVLQKVIDSIKSAKTPEAAQIEFVHYTHHPEDKTSLNNNYVEAIFQDHTGTLWVGTSQSGLNQFIPETNSFISYQHDPRNPLSISHNNIEFIQEDRSGNLWIGTWGGGINKVDRKDKKFCHYKNDPADFNSLCFNYVRAIAEEHSGDLWVGTSGGGLDRFNRKSGTVRHIRNKTEDPQSLSSDDVRAICFDHEDNLWVGTYGGGVNRASEQAIAASADGDLNFSKYLHDPDDAGSLSNDYIWFIFEDRELNLWIGTNAGLNRFDPARETFHHYQNDPADPNSLSFAIARSICQTRNDELWIGTYRGLNRFDPKTESFVRYLHDPKNPLGLSDNGIVSLFEDTDGTLWIGTLGGGLNSFDRRTETFRHYLESEGLPNAFVHAILQDDDGNLWLSTNKGISRFNPRDESGEMFRNYDVSDGLQSNEFNAGAAYRNNRGEMFFGGINGFNQFLPKKVQENPFVPAIAITGFKIFNQDIPLGEAFPQMKEITLSYKLNFFSFEFAALDFTNPRKNQYAYMMEVFDVDWVYSGDRRFASYTNLDPGEYVFRVKGSNNDGIWNEVGTSIKVHITPPFWGTWWFRTLAAISFLGLLGLVYHHQVSSLKKEKAAQERFSKQLIEMQEQERKRIASELHDSLGQNLLIIKNSLEQTIHSPSEKKRSRHEFEELSALASQSIDEVREISYNLHPHLLDRLGLARAVEAIIRKVRQSTEIDFSLDIDQISGLGSRDRDIHVFRIIQEGVNNVVKHSKASAASVWIKRTADSLRITIKDDGRGFAFNSYLSDNSRNEGFGLTGISERVKILQGEFQVKSSKQGTTLDVRIPMDETVR